MYDVIVLGAGAAGLMAAHEFALAGKNVCILEARERIGGRILTINDSNFSTPVEGGAEFVHGDLKLTMSLLKKAEIEYFEVAGSTWQKHNDKLQRQEDFIEDFSEISKFLEQLQRDVSVKTFIEEYLQGEEFEESRFTIKNYVEGYYAADISKASTFSLREELSNSGDPQYRIEGGYNKLIDFLHSEISSRGVEVLLQHAVDKISWRKNAVEVYAGDKKFTSKKVLVTVPIGVLQSEFIGFSPEIPFIKEALRVLGYGAVIKIVFEFDEPFWKDKKNTSGNNLSDVQFIFSGEKIPTWWTQHPKKSAVLTGWLGGPNAQHLSGLTDGELVDTALTTLAHIFNVTTDFLKQMLVTKAVFNWQKDEFSRGAYSYDVVHGDRAKNILSAGVENTIFFAGEGLHQGVEIGTVEAALANGKDTAQRLIATL